MNSNVFLIGFEFTKNSMKKFQFPIQAFYILILNRKFVVQIRLNSTFKIGQTFACDSCTVGKLQVLKLKLN